MKEQRSFKKREPYRNIEGGATATRFWTAHREQKGEREVEKGTVFPPSPKEVSKEDSEPIMSQMRASLLKS